jgi:cytochrome c peroxidase
MSANNTKKLARWAVVAATLSIAVACKQRPASTPPPPPPGNNTPTPPPQRTPRTGEPVAALPEVQVNEQKMLLGRRLFHDTRLSGDNSISCASCHSLDTGGAEHRRVSTGIRGQQGPINAPTVLNSALNFVQFWDGRAADLAAQAAGPVANPAEMGAQWPEVVERVRADAAYLAAFTAAGFADGVTQNNITAAIAEYERSLRTPSRFDQWMLGDDDAITSTERRGYDTFKSVGCTSCHTGAGIGGASYQRMGAVRNYFADRGNLTEADNGRFNVTRQEGDRHMFKVPLLRNVELTAPYLHDGTQATLPDVVRTMGRYQLGIDLTAAQVEDLVAWLKSLTGELPATAREPARPAGTPTPAASGDASAAAPDAGAVAPRRGRAG